jgi:hypothetical protein
VIKFVSKLQQVSPINKTDSCDKTEVFLKVAANTNLPNPEWSE